MAQGKLVPEGEHLMAPTGVSLLYSLRQFPPVESALNVACGSQRITIPMPLIVLVIVLLLIFGGGGFYVGGPTYGGGGLGLVLLIVIIVYFAGGFRSRE